MSPDQISSFREVMAAATKRPWEAETHDDEDTDGNDVFWGDISGPDRKHSVFNVERDAHWALSPENALAIVAAVNNFGALLDECERLREEWNAHGDVCVELDTFKSDEVTRLRAENETRTSNFCTLAKQLEEVAGERDEAKGETARIAAEYESFIAHHDRVVAQRNRDWDALMVLIAKAIGTEEDREAAELDEVDEFDPWHALRTFADTRDSAISERDSLRARLAVIEPVFDAAKNLAPHLQGTGDWACERCRPESDMLHISPGFRCRPHALQDAIDSTLSAATEGGK